MDEMIEHIVGDISIYRALDWNIHGFFTQIMSYEMDKFVQ